MKDTKVCPNCGKEVPADMTLCGYCGSKLLDSTTDIEEPTKETEEELKTVEQPAQQLKTKQPGKDNPSRKIVAGLALIAVICVAAFFVYSNSSAGKYAKANKAIENKDYSTAYNILTGISDYKDSQKLATGCIYEQGKAAMEAKDYQKAKEYFDSIPEYEDAKLLSEQSSHLNDVANDKEAPMISGIDEEIDIKSGIEYNFKDYVADKISISDNVTEEIKDYSVVCDNEAFEQGTGKVDTRKAQELKFTITAKDEAGNEGVFNTKLNIKPIHITKDNHDPVIYDGEYGTIKLVNFTYESRYDSPGYYFDFECKNKTDNSVEYYFASSLTFIKDFQVTSYYIDSNQVAPGKIGQVEFSVEDSEIPEGVGDYDQIETAFCMGNPNEEKSFHYISLIFDTNAAE